MTTTVRGLAVVALLAAGAGRAADPGSQSTGAMGTPRSETDKTATMQRQSSIPSSHLRTVTMTVRSVDPGTHTVMLEVHVSPEANITETGKPIRLDQLKPGDRVRASVDPRSGEVMKLSVTQKGTGSEGTGAGTGSK